MARLTYQSLLLSTVVLSFMQETSGSSMNLARSSEKKVTPASAEKVTRGSAALNQDADEQRPDDHLSPVTSAANQDAEEQRPEEHLCPITCVVMKDPVVASDGRSYERDAIVEWIKTKGISPFTRERLSIELHPNQALRTIISEWRPEAQVRQSMLADMSPDEILKAVREELEKNNALLTQKHTSKDKDIVVFIGNTGAGKSTLINFLAGKSLQVVGQRYALANSGDHDAMPIGSRMFNSETLYPKSIDIETGESGTLRLFDLPGLNDTDGSVRNLVNASFVRQILLDARTIRFVFVAGQDQFTADRGQSVQQTVSAISNLFVTASNPSRPLDSGLFLVNKEDGLIEELRTLRDINIPEQIRIWKDQGRIAGMYHTRLSEQNNEAHREKLVSRIASLDPQKLISINVSSLYPSNTRHDIERMYQRVFEDAYQKAERSHGGSLTEMNRTLEMWMRDIFWDEFEVMYVYGQNPGIEVLKELTLGSYSKVRHKYIEEQEDRRKNHVQNIENLINLKIKELKEGTVARAKDIVKGLLAEQSHMGVVPYDFGNQVEYWIRVCGPEVLERITGDATEQEVIRKAYIGWIGEYFQEQIDRLIEKNRHIRALHRRVDALSRHTEIPEIACGNEDVYQQFLRGKLVYKPNKDNDEGLKEFRISDLANPLSGTFDIRGCGDSDKYLSISTGFRTGKNPANWNKLEVWIVPQFVLQKDPRAKPYNDFLQNREEHRDKPFAVLFNWAHWAGDDFEHEVVRVVSIEVEIDLANALYAVGLPRVEIVAFSHTVRYLEEGQGLRECWDELGKLRYTNE